MKQVDVQLELRVLVARKYRTQSAAAAAWGVSPSMVCGVLAGDRAPMKVMLDDAGIEEQVRYVRVKKGKQQ